MYPTIKAGFGYKKPHDEIPKGESSTNSPGKEESVSYPNTLN